MNTGAPWPTPQQATARVLRIQTKLHLWATDDPHRRFDDLFNLVTDPAILQVAWMRVRGNRGARTAGVDGTTAHDIEVVRGVETFLADLRADLKAREFVPLPVRERMIPKAGGKQRRLNIPTVRDTVAQAALKLVMEPIFEADFDPYSHGFRPRRRAQDAIADIVWLGSNHYQWVLDADIEACFDSIDRTALMGRVRHRVGDNRVLALVKAFLKAGLLTEHGDRENTITGTPQGGILSPLLANIALSALDDHFAERWRSAGNAGQRHRLRTRGGATCRLVRYADDFVVMVAGTREHTEALRTEVGDVLAPLGLRLAEAKTRVVHLDEGFDFLGLHIQRKRRKGSDIRCVYTYPSKKALAAVMAKVRAITRRASQPNLTVLLRRLNSVLRGWCAYFKHGVSSKTFGYLGWWSYSRVLRWIFARHNNAKWAPFRRRYVIDGQITSEDGMVFFDPHTVAIIRYQRRAKVPTPSSADQDNAA